MNHDEVIIRGFADPHRTERYLALLANAKSRETLRSELAHGFALDPRYATKIPGANQSTRDIAAALRSRGAPAKCCCLSEDPVLDAREFELDVALAEIVGRGMGTLLSCVPGQLGYYEAEDGGERYILQRNEKHR